MMKKILLFTVAVFINSVLLGQDTITTSPPLTPNNGQSGITFEFESTQPVNIIGLEVIFSTATSANLWMRTGGVQHTTGQAPNISAANGWTQVITNGTVTGANSTAKVPMAFNSNKISIPANTRMGFFVDGAVQYQTGTAADQTIFTDGTASVIVADNAAYGGGPPTPTFNPRRFLGSVIYELGIIGGCTPFVGFTIDSITANAAKVNWTPGAGNTSFYMEYGTSGFIRGNGTTITGTYPGSQPPVILSGLSPQTAYDVYFGELCNSGGDTAYFPNALSFTTTSLCPAPISVAVSGVTALTADVSVNSPFTSFDVEWGPIGFAQGTGCFATLATTGGVLTISNAAAPGCATQLQPNTSYQFYIRSNCTGVGNGTSVWNGPYLFTTACASYTAPYYNGFENDSVNQAPICWNNYLVGANPQFSAASVYAFGTPHAGSLHVRFYNYNNDTTMLVTPNFSDLTADDKRINFYAQTTTIATGNDLVIGTVSSPENPASFAAIDTIDLSNQYSFYSVDITTSNGYNGIDNYIAFYHASTSSFRTYYIDEFNYEQIPACAPPLQNTLGVSFTTANSAMVYWGSGSAGDETHIEWGTVGFTPGSGTYLGTDSVAGIVDTFGITGLSANTTYEFYIRDSCSVNAFSPWVGPVSFTTKCLITQPAVLPFTDGFESYTAGPYFQDKDFCASSHYWDFESSTPNGRLRLQAGTAFYKNGAQAFTLDHTPSPSTAEDNFITLGIDLSNYTASNGIELNFSYMSHGQETSPTNRVWVRGAPTDPWVQIYDLDVTNGQNGVYFDVTNIDIVGPLAAAGQSVGAGTQIRFGQSGRFTAFSINFSDGFTFDDVSLVEVTCPTPTGLSATNLVDSGATLGWNASQAASSYQVWFGPQGFYQGSSATGGTKRIVTNPQLVLDTLRGKTCYEFVVRYICGPGDTSFFKGPFVFCTPCPIFNAPFVENFDSPNWVASGSNASNILDGCWSSNPDVSDNLEPFKWIPRATGPTSGNGPLMDNTGGNFLYVEASGSASGDSATLTSPPIDLGTLASPALYFDQHRYSNGNLADMDVDISTNFGNSWINLYTVSGDIQTSASAPWVTQFIDLTSYAGNTIMIRFKQIGKGCCGDAAIDNFIVKDVVSADLAIIDGAFDKNSPCLHTNDTVVLSIQNNIGSSVNFATTSLTVRYAVSGPVNSTGSLIVNSGTLLPGDTLQVMGTNANLSLPGIYNLTAYIDPNGANLDPSNDTLLSSVSVTVYPVWEVNPDTVVVITNTTATVDLEAKSPFFGGSDFLFTEIRHFAATGQGTSPSYLTADDYIEITGVPGSDLAGITLEVYSGTTASISYTFPPGTLIGPNGTALIMHGQGAGPSQPANFMYDGRGSYTGLWSSGTDAGYVLKDGATVIDAVTYDAFSFTASSGVTAADWSGQVTGTSGTAGIRLTGPDNNLASDWTVVSSTVTQDPQVLNANVPLPVPGSVQGFSWTLNGIVVDTLPNTVVGPYTTSGIYNYIASFNSPCGMFSDTVVVIVNVPGSCPVPTNLSGVAVACDSVVFSWNSAADSSLVSYVATGGVPSSASLVVGDSSFAVGGLMASTAYDFYVVNICGGDTGTIAGPYTINTGNAGAPLASFTAMPVGFSLTVDFNATASTGSNATYAWDFGDGTNGTGITTSHTYATGGAYSIMLTVTNACGSDDTTITLADVSVGENALGRGLSVYPNPTTGSVMVEFKNAGGESSLILTDMSGRTVRRVALDGLAGHASETLSLQGMAKGIYTLEVRSGDMVAYRRISLQ